MATYHIVRKSTSTDDGTPGNTTTYSQILPESGRKSRSAANHIRNNWSDPNTSVEQCRQPLDCIRLPKQASRRGRPPKKQETQAKRKPRYIPEMTPQEERELQELIDSQDDGASAPPGSPERLAYEDALMAEVDAEFEADYRAPHNLELRLREYKEFRQSVHGCCTRCRKAATPLMRIKPLNTGRDEPFCKPCGTMVQADMDTYQDPKWSNRRPPHRNYAWGNWDIRGRHNDNRDHNWTDYRYPSN